MIYFIYGEDSYRSKKKLEEIIAGYKKVHSSGLNLLSINAKDEEFSNMYQALSTHSMFAEKKLAIVYDASANKKFQDDFLEKIDELHSSKNIIVVYEQKTINELNNSGNEEEEIEEEEIDEYISLFEELIDKVICQECSHLLPLQIKKWTQLEFEKNKIKITDEAVGMLLNYVPGDLWVLSQEIRKLGDYKRGGVVTKEDVALCIKPDIQNDIFKTIDAMVSSQNKKQAFLLFKKHIENGDNPLYLLSMIVYQFRNFLIIKEMAEQKISYAEMVKKSKLHPFVVKKSVALCNQFSMEKLKKIYQKIFQVDADIKTGKIEPGLAIDLLLAEI